MDVPAWSRTAIAVCPRRLVACQWFDGDGAWRTDPMTTAVQTLLDSFDALSEVERHEAAVELLRRVAPPAKLPDEALVAAADEVFRELDAREAADARPEPR